MYDQVTMKLNVDPLILSALREDITSEDVSANCVMRRPQQGEADLICKEDGVICGLQVFARVFALLDEAASVEFLVQDGTRFTGARPWQRSAGIFAPSYAGSVLR